MFLVFLDWEKTFDETDKEKLMEAMQRLGTPEKIIKILIFLCKPKVRGKGHGRKIKLQKTMSRDQTGMLIIPMPIRMSHVSNVS